MRFRIKKPILTILAFLMIAVSAFAQRESTGRFWTTDRLSSMESPRPGLSTAFIPALFNHEVEGIGIETPLIRYTDLTLMAWVYPEVESGTRRAVILGDYENRNWVRLNLNRGSVTLKWNNETTEIILTKGFDSGEWQHFALLRSMGEIRIFRNGTMVGESTKKSPFLPSALGRKGPANPNFFGGSMDRLLLLDEDIGPDAILREWQTGRETIGALLVPVMAANARVLTAENSSLPNSKTPTAEFLQPPPGTFTVAVIPDTQRFLGAGSGRGDDSRPTTNPAFTSRTRWLADNLEAQNIVFVTHVGDIVDRNEPGQWRIARDEMDRFHGRVPYGISVGNHDMTSSGDASLFQAHFGADRYRDHDWYGGTYSGQPGNTAVSGNNANSFQLVSAEGVDLVFLHLECNAPDDVLAWADSVLEAHSDRLAVITTHMYLGPVSRPRSGQSRAEIPLGRMEWIKRHGERGNNAEQMWNKSFRKHPNLIMILAGDQSGTIAYRKVSKGDHGNAVHEVMQDYPRDRDESDWVRLFRFHPDESRISVWTYSPAQDALCLRAGSVTDPGQHQFELEFSTTFRAHPAGL